ncbi:hypothetical protein IL306_010016 [Fusarium sp. DS 682]|nr:hypothetical protein IL306_010016 [Fusarium sp. DS 682]
MATIQRPTPPNASETTDSSERPATPRVIRSVVHDEGLPEVVHPNQPTNVIEYYDAPIPVDSETDKRYNEAPIPITTIDNSEPPPPLPARHSTNTPQPQYPYPYSPGGYAQPQQPGFGAQSPQLPPYNNNQVVTYVTPLDQLGDHPKFVDCPFCRCRAETRVKKTSSKMTHVSAAALGFTTIAGAAVPYAGKWASHTVHYCSNCDHKVAIRKWGSRQMKPLGTPDHLMQASRYAPAHSPSMSSGSTRVEDYFIDYNGRTGLSPSKANRVKYEFSDLSPRPKLTLTANLPHGAISAEVERVLFKNGFRDIICTIEQNTRDCVVTFPDWARASNALDHLNIKIKGNEIVAKRR